MDKEKRIQQIADRYTPPLDKEAVRERFTTKPRDTTPELNRGFRITGRGEQRINDPQKPAMSRKHRLRQRRQAKES